MFELLEKYTYKIIENIAHRIISSGIANDEKSIEKYAKQSLFYLYNVLSYVLIKTVSNSVGSDTLSAVIVDISKKYPYLSAEYTRQNKPSQPSNSPKSSNSKPFPLI